jgi:rubrerythrin
MNASDVWLRLQGRAVWADAHRTLATLESFARTEADGGRDIATAARRVDDPELRGHLERHARDELKHAELFRRRARELRATAEAADGAPASPTDRAYDLSRGRPSSEVDAHGFFTLGLLDALGEVPYVAMLHVAEQRAARLFTVHRDLTRADAPTCAVFQEILRDEQYHVAWTAAMLERWRGEGKGEQVKAALRAARTSRAMGAWKRAGLRSAAGFGRLVMLLCYVPVLVPFGLAARARRRAGGGWQAPPDAPGPDALRSQA